MKFSVRFGLTFWIGIDYSNPSNIWRPKFILKFKVFWGYYVDFAVDGTGLIESHLNFSLPDASTTYGRSSNHDTNTCRWAHTAIWQAILGVRVFISLRRSLCIERKGVVVFDSDLINPMQCHSAIVSRSCLPVYAPDGFDIFLFFWFMCFDIGSLLNPLGMTG